MKTFAFVVLSLLLLLVPALAAPPTNAGVNAKHSLMVFTTRQHHWEATVSCTFLNVTYTFTGGGNDSGLQTRLTA
jgi:hypothetical protein